VTVNSQASGVSASGVGASCLGESDDGIPPSWRFIAATAVFGYLRRQIVMLTSFATGVLLMGDAWFDVMMSNREDGMTATVTALLVELPLAGLLLVGAIRLLWRVSWRYGMVNADSRPWQVPIPLGPNEIGRRPEG
jgi:hypothetical protein